MADTTVELLLPILTAAVAAELHLTPTQAAAFSKDVGVLATAHANGRDTTAALEDLATMAAGEAAARSGNAVLVNAGKVLADFPAAHASAKAGQAVVIATPTIEGDKYLLSLEKEGGPAAQSLGL